MGMLGFRVQSSKCNKMGKQGVQGFELQMQQYGPVGLQGLELQMQQNGHVGVLGFRAPNATKWACTVQGLECKVLKDTHQATNDVWWINEQETTTTTTTTTQIHCKFSLFENLHTHFVINGLLVNKVPYCSGFWVGCQNLDTYHICVLFATRYGSKKQN